MAGDRPIHFDFMSLMPLKKSEMLFYEAGVMPDEALDLLDTHLASLKEFARFLIVHTASRVLGDPAVLSNRNFADSVRLNAFDFSPVVWEKQWAQSRGQGEMQKWSFDVSVLEVFRPQGPFEMASESSESSSLPKLQTFTKLSAEVLKI